MALPRTGLSQDMPRELVEGREDVEGVEPANRTNEEFAETEATKVGSEGLRRDDAPRGGGSEEERDGQEGNSLETGLRARTLSPLEEDLVAAGGIIESKPASSNQKNNVQDAVLPLPATSRRFTTGAGPAESLHSENDPLNPSLVDKSTTWPRDSHIRIQASPSTSPVQQEQAVAGPSTIPGPAPKTPNVSPDPSPSAPTLEIPTPQAPTRLPGQAAATPQMKNQTHLDIDRAIKTTTVHFVRKQSSRPGDRNIEVVKVPTNIEDLLDNPLQPLAPLNSDSTSNLPFLRWYHLPSNNMAWVEVCTYILTCVERD
ncbi:hypothetical protein P154DRAFT_99643 [Amniculicola lignicola CBS 123094]|uniref:Uncharacterized protein n=1 Tax=Amniculicola lignicola CBS 123094 TaxID=1392246 RepID=A0A6A5WVU2_9PLEO|nr:hypothetical protein P154DRAFT_99643 [Amniculicola lignicola CBS 123094]